MPQLADSKAFVQKLKDEGIDFTEKDFDTSSLKSTQADFDDMKVLQMMHTKEKKSPIVISRDSFVIIMTMIGIISLAGIVVNNAIVLIDFIELTRKRKRAELGIEKGLLPYDEILQSIISAGKTRLRPVLLTAITTILGLIPLAVGLNIDFISFFNTYDPDFYMGGENVAFWGPMSWTIVFGLTFSTFLTLVIVPVMYLLTDKINYRISLMRTNGK